MTAFTNHGFERVDERYDGVLTKEEFVNHARHRGKEARDIINSKLAQYLRSREVKDPTTTVKYYKGYIFVFRHKRGSTGLVLITVWPLGLNQRYDFGGVDKLY